MPNFVFLGVKYLFRTIHMLSFAYLFGNFSYDYFFGFRSNTLSEELLPKLKRTNIIIGVLLILTGLINMIILLKEKNYVRDSAYYLWRRTFEVMFCISLVIFTPLFDMLCGKFGVDDREVLFKWKLIMMTVIFLLSPALRFYRETYMSVKVDSLLENDKQKM